ncbi:MAG: dihydrofolate reductase family protein [Solirubrobacterales bacterium]
MSRLVYSTTMSLDGFIAGAGGDMQWLSAHAGGSNPQARALLDRTGALLIGARTFGGDDPNAGTDQEGAFGGAWSGPSIVLTHDAGRSSGDPDVTFVDDLERAAALAIEAAGTKDVTVLGADVSRQLIEHGLLDEILVMVAPVLLGDGVRLFELAGGTDVRLDLVERPEGDLPCLRYRVLDA